MNRLVITFIFSSLLHFGNAFSATSTIQPKYMKIKTIQNTMSIFNIITKNETTLVYTEANVAYAVVSYSLSRYDLPKTPAYIFKIRNAIRGALFVDENDTTKAIRFVYDPILLLQKNSISYMRECLDLNELSLDNLPTDERFDLEFM